MLRVEDVDHECRKHKGRINMGVRPRLVELGWEYLEGAALKKASEVLGYDIGPDAYAQKFSRKSVFLRDCAGLFKHSVPFDRDDPDRQQASSGSKLYERWPSDPEIANDIARDLVEKFHELTE